jgi:tetratricopeptide (TPR) repeat protein
MHAQKNENEQAIKLLNEALGKDPTTEMVEKLRLRLGACHLARNDFAAAFAALDGLAQNPKSPLAAEARVRAAECLIRQGGDGPAKANWDKAVAYLIPFRDQGPLQNVAGVSDRALLRLGHTYGYLGQWDPSRQAMEILTQRFPQSQWIHEARYGIAWAWQNQKQHDNAVNTYKQVVAGTAAEVAAKAQLQIGLCRLEQKKHAEAANALLVVPFTYDYPELSALALCEASRCFVELKDNAQAVKLLEKVVKDHPQSKWAQVAKQRMAEIK